MNETTAVVQYGLNIIKSERKAPVKRMVEITKNVIEGDPEITEIEKAMVTALIKAKGIVTIEGHVENSCALEFIGEIKAMSDAKGTIDAGFDYYTTVFNGMHKTATGIREKWKTALKNEATRIGLICGNWSREQDIIIAEREAELRKKAAEDEAETKNKLLEEAAVYESQGHADIADLVFEEAATFKAVPPTVPREPKKVKTGAGKRVELQDVYNVNVINEEKLIAWLIRNQKLDCLKINQSKVNAYVEEREMSGNYPVIGINVWVDSVVK